MSSKSASLPKTRVVKPVQSAKSAASKSLYAGIPSAQRALQQQRYFN